MKVRLLIAAVLLIASPAFAQQWPFEFWHDGKIVLITGDTLRGLVKYDMQQDLVQYNDRNNNVEAFTPRKVLFVEIFDATANTYRSFFSLPYAATGNYRTPVFFELLEEGKMTLLAREALEYRTFGSVYYYGSYTRLVLVYKFFFMDERGNIREFTGKRNDLIRMMGKQGDDVDKFIRVNNLKIDDRNDFARIIAYYNSLFKS